MEEKSLPIEAHRIRVGILFKQSYSTQLVGLANAFIFLFLVHEVNPPWAILSAATFVSLTFFARLRLQQWFMRTHIEGKTLFEPFQVENLFALGTFIKGMEWGLAGALLVPPGAEAQQAMFSFILAGTTAGASVAYSASVRTIMAFLLPSILPFAARMLWIGEVIPMAMSLLLVFYVVLLAVLSRGLNGHVMDSILYRFQMDEAIQELRATQAKFAYSAKMAALGEMSGAIAHEINNPLAIIRGAASLMESSLRDGVPMSVEKSKTMLEKIDRTVVRIAKIVSGLKTFAREGDADPFEMTPLSRIVQDTLELCNARFKSRGIPVEVTLPENEILLLCRGVQVSQVLLNLLNNAFDALEAKAPHAQGAGGRAPQVRIVAEESAHGTCIRIIDNGCGVPHEIRDKIMLPFFTTKEPNKGTGLGLSIAHGIMVSHGGSLKLEAGSVDTSFALTFPPANSARISSDVLRAG